MSNYRQEQAQRLMAAAAAAAKDFSNEILLDIDSDFMLVFLHFPQALRRLTLTSNLLFSSSGGTISNGGSNNSRACRSRSNSWRGPAPRRSYSVLKEESEEELTKYLRSSSRQSSRYEFVFSRYEFVN